MKQLEYNLTDREEMKWINCGKCVAILAVLLDHTYKTLYTNSGIAYASYFSVSLFVILSGITSYVSYDRRKTFCIRNRILKIIIPYAVATAIYQIVYNRFFDFDQYLEYLFDFNVSGPFYFILLYIQLILISPILYKSIKKISLNKFSYMFHVVLLGFIVLISYFTTNYTNIRSVYGGGGKLFGGTYLVLFYIGMMIARRNFSWKTSKGNLLAIFISVILYLVWLIFAVKNRFALDQMLPFGNGLNPPSITSGLMSVIILDMVFAIVNYCENYLNSKWITRVVGGGNYLG